MTFKKLSDAERWKKLSKTDPNQAAGLFGEESQEKATEIAEQLGVSYMEEVVSQLDCDTAAELLRNLPKEFAQKVLETLPREKCDNLKEILAYAPGTAGAIMSKEFLAVSLDATLKEAALYLQALPSNKKGRVSYIYVVDKERRLVGVIQIRDIIFHSPDRLVKDILVSPVVQVEVGMSQSDVAKLLRRHRFLGLPVVDGSQRLVGVVSADNVLTAMEEETADDIAKIVGTGAEEIKTHSIFTILKLRFPWLLVNIASGIACAFISGVFQNDIRTVAALFLFVPVALGLSESTGVQGATIVVRNITLGHVTFKDLGPLFMRETVVGVLIGVACGLIVGAVATVWQANSNLGLALAASMTLAIFVSSLIGLVLPIVFRRMKIDPAFASGPLVLAICDLQTLVVYFWLASKILAG